MRKVKQVGTLWRYQKAEQVIWAFIATVGVIDLNTGRLINVDYEHFEKHAISAQVITVRVTMDQEIKFVGAI